MAAAAVFLVAFILAPFLPVLQGSKAARVSPHSPEGGHRPPGKSASYPRAADIAVGPVQTCRRGASSNRQFRRAGPKMYGIRCLTCVVHGQNKTAGHTMCTRRLRTNDQRLLY